MSCEIVEAELVSFHFATVDEPTRALIEAHLLSCGRCLRSYLEIKRHLETASSDIAPSSASRARLRAAVSAHLHPAPAPWKWWERPLAFGFATAALVMAVVTTWAISVSPGAPPRAWLVEHHSAPPSQR